MRFGGAGGYSAVICSGGTAQQHAGGGRLLTLPCSRKLEPENSTRTPYSSVCL